MRIKTVDIAICTWNRAGRLRRTLESFSKLDVPPDVQLTVIVIDNRSTDDTQPVIEAFANSSFGQTHQTVSATEQQQGHTFARNRAIKASQGDLVIWTDDDVLVNPDWVTKYVDAATQQPSVSFPTEPTLPSAGTSKEPICSIPNWAAAPIRYSAKTNWS